MRAIVFALLVACGPSTAVKNIAPVGRQSTHLDPVDPKAQKQFEAAMRAIRLGGPDANDTARA